MKQDLFNKELEPKCEYCLNGTLAPTGTEYLCIVKGIVKPDYACKKFEYDPLKRQPRREIKLGGDYSASDFKL